MTLSFLSTIILGTTLSTTLVAASSVEAPSFLQSQGEDASSSDSDTVVTETPGATEPSQKPETPQSSGDTPTPAPPTPVKPAENQKQAEASPQASNTSPSSTPPSTSSSTSTPISTPSEESVPVTSSQVSYGAYDGVTTQSEYLSSPLLSLNNDTVEAFIKSIAPRVSELAEKNDLYASLIIAQAILESGYGHSAVSLYAHNLFNITGAYEGEAMTISSGSYRAYGSYDASLMDYVRLMLEGTTWNNQIYAGTWKTNSKSVKEAAQDLQGAFATDPEYATKLIQIIKEYNLTTYDEPTETSQSKDAPESPLLGEQANNLQFPEYNNVQYAGAESYAWGNCTQYVYNRIHQLGGTIGQTMGNGGDWGANAAAQGYFTTSTPQVGYAVSFSAGVAGASLEYGHVAFVEHVNEDGSILVSEMNVKGLNVVDYRTISASEAAQGVYIQPGK